MHLISIIVNTGYDIRYILGHYKKICSYTGNDCNGFLCKSDPIGCKYYTPTLFGLTYNQMLFLSSTFEYLNKEEFSLNKRNLIEVLNAFFGNEKSVKISNVLEKNTFEMMKYLYSDYFENSTILLSQDINNSIMKYMAEADKDKKEERYQELYKSTISKLIQYPRIHKEFLYELNDIDENHGIMITVIKIIKQFPYHRTIIIDSQIEESIKKEINTFKLKNNRLFLDSTEILMGCWDTERSNLLKEGSQLEKVIAFHNNYYYLYKNHFTDLDETFWLLLEIEEYLDSIKISGEIADKLKEQIKEIFNIDLERIGDKIKNILGIKDEN